MEKKVIIVGASSGIGRALAEHYAAEGYELGLMARRLDLLQEIKASLNVNCLIKESDVSNISDSVQNLEKMMNDMSGVDTIVLNAGINNHNSNFDVDSDEQVIDINVSGFVSLANVCAKYFLEQGKGTLVGISSIAGVRGSGKAPVYSASKAFVSNYMVGLRQRLHGKPIHVVDIRPGFVDTAMISDVEKKFWVATPQKAAKQIYEAAIAKRKITYVTRRWGWVAAFYGILPEWFCVWVYLRFLRREK